MTRTARLRAWANQAKKLRMRFARASALIFVVAITACARQIAPHDVQAEIAAAREVFHRNLDAIRKKDKAAYLACYRADEALVRNGPGGPKLGFAELAAGTSSTSKGWPRSLEASDVQLHWLGPGYVYGSYRYRVDFEGAVSEGISERVFARVDGRWQIVVTTAFGAPASSDPGLADVAFLEGTWAESDGDRVTEEWWTPARGGSMLGASRTLKQGTAVAFEHLRIERTGDLIELIAAPSGQATTRFRLTERGAGSVTFENPAHDFPRRIQYRRDGDVLVAKAEGAGPTLEWRYTRR